MSTFICNYKYDDNLISYLNELSVDLYKCIPMDLHSIIFEYLDIYEFFIIIDSKIYTQKHQIFLCNRYLKNNILFKKFSHRYNSFYLHMLYLFINKFPFKSVNNKYISKYKNIIFDFQKYFQVPMNIYITYYNSLFSYIS